jgi:putative phage-type endonuclease
MPAIQHKQGSPEWFTARQGRITASLAGAILGLDPHKGQLAAFNEITGIKAAVENDAMRWGKEFESKARDAYESHTSRLAFETTLWIHPECEWLAASPDGLVGADGLVELKCPHNLPTEIPPHHEIQMRVQMACTGRAWVDYFVWTHDGHFLQRIERDVNREIALLIDLSTWRDTYLVPNIAPPRSRRKRVQINLEEGTTEIIP